MGSLVRQGDGILLNINSGKVITVSGEVTARMKDGTYETLITPQRPTGAAFSEDAFRSVSQFSQIGEVVSAVILSPAPGSRGETYARLHSTYGAGGQIRDRLVSGYLYGARNLALGDSKGPREGPGFIHPRLVASPASIPIDVQSPLGEPNRLRRIDGFVWYYHCSGDTANRTMRASIRDMGNGLPAGMTSGALTTAKFWPSAAALTLSANEEGMIYVNANTGKSFATSLDNGAATIEPITTEPDPLPYWAQEDDVAEILFDVALAEAADRHTIYIFEESWVDI